MTGQEFKDGISEVLDKYGWDRKYTTNKVVRYSHKLGRVTVHKMSFTVSPDMNYDDKLYVSNPLFITRKDDNLDSHLRWKYLHVREAVEAKKFGDFKTFYKRFGL
mgnify:FL=1